MIYLSIIGINSNLGGDEVNLLIVRVNAVLTSYELLINFSFTFTKIYKFPNAFAGTVPVNIFKFSLNLIQSGKNEPFFSLISKLRSSLSSSTKTES